jgi:hypothetical protein
VPVPPTLPCSHSLSMHVAASAARIDPESRSVVRSGLPPAIRQQRLPWNHFHRSLHRSGCQTPPPGRSILPDHVRADINNAVPPPCRQSRTLPWRYWSRAAPCPPAALASAAAALLARRAYSQLIVCSFCAAVVARPSLHHHHDPQELSTLRRADRRLRASRGRRSWLHPSRSRAVPPDPLQGTQLIVAARRSLSTLFRRRSLRGSSQGVSCKDRVPPCNPTGQEHRTTRQKSACTSPAS